jgi:spectinomycin phosphotransferase
MREPPGDLSSNMLAACLASDYGLTVTEITFLSLGNDSSAWVYRVRTTNGMSYFLKALRRTVTELSLLVPQYLHDHGMTQVIAPLPTAMQTLRTDLNGYTVILYPFVEGASGKEQVLTPVQWVSFGGMVRAIHATTLPSDVVAVMLRETFQPPGADLVHDLDAHIGDRTFKEPAANRIASFWRAHRAEIRLLLHRAQDLGRQLARRSPPLVLCHADIHTANVLVGSDGQLWIVDWDEAVLAPKERDLMFVVRGGIDDRLVGPCDEQRFFAGYGATALDPLGLTYYRYAWAISDISAFGADVFLRSELSAAVKATAADQFMSLFESGRIVTKAFASPPP